MKKKTKVAIELIEKYLETTMGQDDQVLLEEKKYHFINKFSPKKCPNEQVKREDIKNLYSWIHHAPQTWFCLLYTSPSPRDYAASRMPSSA